MEITPRIIVTEGAGANANWVTVPDNEATARIDAELDTNIRELAKSHQAARDDYFEYAYPQPTAPTRISRILRRIF